MNTSDLIDFKDLKISNEELENKLGGNLFEVKVDSPVTIHTEDLINVLNAFKFNKITCEQLLEWVNTIWFTDLFDYCNEQCDSIAGVMNILEELDEDNNTLTDSEIDKLIYALSNSKEI